MQVLTDWHSIDPALRGGVVTIGNYDGVHLGHAHLLEECRRRATGRPVVVITFEPHPAVILAPGRAPRRLSTRDEKLRLLSESGVDVALVLRTDRALLSMTAQAFVEQVLVAPLQPTHVIEGPDFGFGAGRRGNVDTLRELGGEFGFEVCVVLPATADIGETQGRQIVSSSLVRRLIREGRVDAVTACLGRPYATVGPVVEGAGVGRTLGFPTVNLDIGDLEWPADGVYAGRAGVDDASYAAAVSVGTRPTFDGQRRVFEAFLLGEPGSLYGRGIRVELLRWLREQQRFASPEELARQIARDVEAVRAALGVT